MKEQKFSEDQVIISRHKDKSSNLVRNYSETIPFDLLMDIFSRVPAKSIARFRCISKFWASILARLDFTELFLTKSSNRPRILFAIEVNEETLVFSSPQPRNPDEDCSLVTTHYKYYPEHVPTKICQHLFGLVNLQKWNRYERVICNPVTGKFIILPEPKTKVYHETSYLCYDPTNKQFKVLCMIWFYNEGPISHFVLTLETRKYCWRRIECKPYSPCNNDHSDGICVNGMLYYKADNTDSSIVFFDVRNEKFSFISIDMFEDNHWILTNYKGKLGAHCSSSSTHHPFDTELVLWVLEDVVNNKWSKHICVLTPLWESNNYIEYNVRVNCAGEIVFSPRCLSNPFYIFYYNFERNTFTRVEIQGLQEFADGTTYISTFLDYVENMKLLNGDDNGCKRSKRPRKPNPKYL